MSFGAPLGLLALLALPAVLWLHFFRRRLRERPVAGLFLFRDAAPPSAAGRKRQRLRRTASLVCELLAAASLALLLAEPRRAGGSAAGGLLIVLDDGASMGAVGEDGRDAAARARSLAAEALDDLPLDARATLLATGEPPAVLAGPRAPVALVRAALSAWTPRAPRQDFAPACALALDLAAPGDRLLLLTDDPDSEPPAAFERIACGRPLGNAALARAAREPAAADGAAAGAAAPGTPTAGETLHVDVSATGGVPRTDRLLVWDAAAPGVPLFEQALDLLPDATVRVSLALPAALRERLLLVRLADGGALALDDVARLPPERPALVSVADLLPADVSRVLGVDRLLASVPGLVRATNPAGAQLVFATAQGALPAGRVELVVAPSGGGTAAFLGPFLSDRRHPLLLGVTLDGVLWAAGSEPVPGAPLVLAGDLPLIAEESAPLARRCFLNLDAVHSSLPRSPDWPILVSNLAELARTLRPGLARARVLVGEELAWRGGPPAAPPGTVAGGAPGVAPGAAPRAAPGDEPVVLVAPDGSERRAAPGPEATFLALQPGEYVLRCGGDELARVQVDFVDDRESDVSRCGEGRRAATSTEVAAGDGGEGRDPLLASLLAALLLAALAANWWVLRRGGAS